MDEKETYHLFIKIPVIGINGVGKTTLIKRIFNKNTLKSNRRRCTNRYY